MNPGGIRAVLPYANSPGGEAPGEVTYGEAFTVQPFNNLVVTQTLTGAQLKEVLEQQFVGYDGQTTQRILQVSAGLNYSLRHAPPPVGSQVSDLALNGTPIDPAAELPGHHERLPGQRRGRVHRPDRRHGPDHRARLRRRRPGRVPGRRGARSPPGRPTASPAWADRAGGVPVSRRVPGPPDPSRVAADSLRGRPGGILDDVIERRFYFYYGTGSPAAVVAPDRQTYESPGLASPGLFLSRDPNTGPQTRGVRR